MVLMVAGRRANFVDVTSFDFALLARTSVSAAASRWLGARTRPAIDSELQLLRRARRRLEAEMLDRAHGKEGFLKGVLEEIAKLRAIEHGWTEILEGLLNAPASARAFQDVALVRFGQYLADRELALAEARRACGTIEAAEPRGDGREAGATTEMVVEDPDDPLRETQELPGPSMPLQAVAPVHTAAPEAGKGLLDEELRSRATLAGSQAPPTEQKAQALPVTVDDFPLSAIRNPPRSNGAPVAGATPLATTARLSNACETDSPREDPTPAGSPDEPPVPTGSAYRRLTRGRREALDTPPGSALTLWCAGLEVRLLPHDEGLPNDDTGFRLQAGPNVLGRDAACDIVLRGTGNRISRMHVVVVCEGHGRYGVTDLSRNGTWCST